MKTRFNIQMMDEALAFMYKLDGKSRTKVAFAIQKAKEIQDPKIFKKITVNIWEFRIKYFKSQIRFFAFWDPFEKSLVVCTHGMYKKSQKTPRHEIDKAENLRLAFIQMKKNEKK
jgi:phage-related protein